MGGSASIEGKKNRSTKNGKAAGKGERKLLTGSLRGHVGTELHEKDKTRHGVCVCVRASSAAGRVRRGGFAVGQRSEHTPKKKCTLSKLRGL